VSDKLARMSDRGKALLMERERKALEAKAKQEEDEAKQVQSPKTNVITKRKIEEQKAKEVGRCVRPQAGSESKGNDKGS
jgi:hypothetical protein